MGVDAAAQIEHLVAQAVAVVKQKQVQVAEDVQGHVVAPGQGVALGQDEVELLLVQRGLREGGHAGGQGQHRGVDGAGTQGLDEVRGRLLDDARLQLRQLLADAEQEVGQDIGRDRRNETDGQRAGELIGAARRAGDDVVHDLRDLARVGQDAAAEWRDQDPTGRALHELDAEATFEGGQRL